ncbi:MAG: DUF4845 domain-containing protein [Immundisolibacteraceae bacterium]|nr:DUF4845 domain-containing protein [Immundisolibacteraceae bacterium]
MNNHKQHGITVASILIILVVLGFFFLSFLKLFPAYNEFFSVQSTMKGLATEEKISTMTRKQMWNALYNRFDINGISTPAYDDLYVEYNRETKMREISIYYEYRVPMFGNIDAIMTFDAPIEVPGN